MFNSLNNTILPSSFHSTYNNNTPMYGAALRNQNGHLISSSVLNERATIADHANSSDFLYDESTEDCIIKFVQYVSTPEPLKLYDLSQYIEFFKQSVILSTLMRDPKNKQAIVCVRDFLLERPHLPQYFLIRLLSLMNTRISFNYDLMSSTNLSCKVTVVPENTQPTKKLDWSSAQVIRKSLEESIKNSNNYITFQECNANSPSAKPLEMNHMLVNQIVMTMVDLQDVIEESNRQNGLDFVPYIKKDNNDNDDSEYRNCI